MIRTRVKGTGIKASSSPDTEPNFYTMPPVMPVQTLNFAKSDNKMQAEVTPPNSPSKDDHEADKSPASVMEQEPTCPMKNKPDTTKDSEQNVAYESGITEGTDRELVIFGDKIFNYMDPSKPAPATPRWMALNHTESNMTDVSIAEAERKEEAAMDAFFLDFDIPPGELDLESDDDKCLCDILDKIVNGC